MFGRKKKEEKLPITHNVLGDIVIEPFVRTVNSYEISLFGRKYTFYLYVNSSEFKGKGSFTTEQERTIAFFISNLSDIEKSLENQLKCFFECDDYSAFINSIILENITISPIKVKGLSKEEAENKAYKLLDNFLINEL